MSSSFYRVICRVRSISVRDHAVCSRSWTAEAFGGRHRLQNDGRQSGRFITMHQCIGKAVTNSTAVRRTGGGASARTDWRALRGNIRGFIAKSPIYLIVLSVMQACSPSQKMYLAAISCRPAHSSLRLCAEQSRCPPIEAAFRTCFSFGGPAGQS